MCCDEWDLTGEGEEGECEACGGETVDGTAKKGCHYSPEECAVCHSCPCDLSC